MQIVTVFLIGSWWCLYNLCSGLWMLFRHPITFMKFAQEYRRFESTLDGNDLLAESGFYNMSRKERRLIERNAAKEAQRRWGNKITGNIPS